MAPQNTAAWLMARRRGLVVDDAPYPTPVDDQLVVRSRAVAVNPADWVVQATPRAVFPYLRPPVVLGNDVAGEVVQVGPEVTRFQVGDRVLGHALGAERRHDHRAEGAFQRYTILHEHMAAPIPDSLPYAHAAVLPLGLSTAASGLFQADQLGLAHPSADPSPSGSCVLVCGGATSLGHNAVQLARAAGYEVIATCSPHNARLVTQLGATATVDYHGPTVVEDLLAALGDRPLAGALALAPGCLEECIRVVSRAQGRRLIAQAGGAVSLSALGRGLGSLPGLMLRMGVGQTRATLAARRRGVKIKLIWGASLADNEVSRIIYRDFLPTALSEGRYRAAPEPLVVGDGLDRLQAALDRQRAGVSARKVVVTLGDGS